VSNCFLRKTNKLLIGYTMVSDLGQGFLLYYLAKSSEFLVVLMLTCLTKIRLHIVYTSLLIIYILIVYSHSLANYYNSNFQEKVFFIVMATLRSCDPS